MSRSLLRKTPCGPILFSVNLPQASDKFSYGRLITRGLTVIICFYPKIFFDHFSLRRLPLVNKMSEHALLIICPYDLNIVLDAWLIVTAWNCLVPRRLSRCARKGRRDEAPEEEAELGNCFQAAPQAIGSISAVSRVRSLILPEERGMSAGSFSRTAAGNRAYSSYICFYLFLSVYVIFQIFDVNVKSAFLLAKDVIPLMEKSGFVDLFVLLLF